MRIALDAQQLFEKEKTGVAWNAKKIIDGLIDDTSNSYVLNYFWRRELDNEKAIVQYYRSRGCVVRKCGLVMTLLYKLVENIHAIPYSWIFRDKVDVTQFFNFVIPRGVNGKTVTIVHDMAYKACPETVKEKTRMWLERNLERTCKDATIIATVSEFSKKEIEKYFGTPENKIKVIFNGVDHERYHPGYSQQEIENVKKKFHIQGSYFLYLGTLEPRKNIEEIVEAYGRLVKRREHYPKLVLAGRKGWMFESIFDKIKEYGIESDVICTGYLDDDEKVRLICGASAFLFLSLYEGFGIPPLEAMACGVPVIVSDRTSLPEVVGDAGIKVSLGEPQKLTEQMERLVDDAEFWEERKRSGIEQAKKFSWDRTVKLLKEVYLELEKD